MEGRDGARDDVEALRQVRISGDVDLDALHIARHLRERDARRAGALREADTRPPTAIGACTRARQRQRQLKRRRLALDDRRRELDE